MAYADIDQLKEYANIKAVQTNDDALLERLLDVATAEINRVCRRSFSATTATRVYGADSYTRLRGQVLFLDTELLTITELTNGQGTVIPSDGYWLEPRNEPPYSMIRLKSSYYWLVDVDQDITVEGTWGYSATPPADIVQACLELAKYLYALRENQNYDVVSMPDMGQVIIPGGTPKHVTLALAAYIRRGLY